MAGAFTATAALVARSGSVLVVLVFIAAVAALTLYLTAAADHHSS